MLQSIEEQFNNTNSKRTDSQKGKSEKMELQK